MTRERKLKKPKRTTVTFEETEVEEYQRLAKEEEESFSGIVRLLATIGLIVLKRKRDETER